MAKAASARKYMCETLPRIARHDRVEHFAPAISTVEIAGAKRTAFQVAELVEQEKRMVTDTGVIPFQTLISCSPWVGLTLKSMSSTMPLGGRQPCTRSIHRPDKSGRAESYVPAVSQRVSKRPIWLGDAAAPEAALPPTIQRIAGSCRRRRASLTSSYPASRPNTDCRNNPTSAWRPFLPVRASAGAPPLRVL